MLIKAGVDISRLKRKIRKTLCVVDKIYEEYGLELVITSTYDGNHSACSYHYANDAYDIRWRPCYGKDVYMKIKKALGDDFDVVLEKDHIHIEYDPKPKPHKE